MVGSSLGATGIAELGSIASWARSLATFRAASTQRNLASGSAHGGRDFEVLVGQVITEYVADLPRTLPECVLQRLTCMADKRTCTCHQSGRYYLAASLNERTMVWAFEEAPEPSPSLPETSVACTWLKKEYEVRDWYDPRLHDSRITRWLPAPGDETCYVGPSSYPKLYAGKTTKFDGTILFIEKGALRSKRLVEAKSGKSNGSGGLDGNAHERFAYQSLEYLEIAELNLELGIELLLMTNDAFVAHRNKYHTGFAVHALRLSTAFPSYKFNMVGTTSQYTALLEGWSRWLRSGGTPP